MTSTNDGKDVKSNLTSGPKGKTYYIELYKSLEARLSESTDVNERTSHLCEAWRRVHSLCLHSAPSTHLHLLSWLQRHTARTVLQTGWQSPKRKDDRKRLEDAINDFISESNEAKATRVGETPPWEAQLVTRGEWYKTILEKPWDHPVLSLLLNPNGTPPSDDEVLKWLKQERGVTFVMRLHTLVGEKCEDIACSLASCVMDRVRAAMPQTTQADDDDNIPDKPTSPLYGGSFADILREEAGFTTDVWEMLTDIEFVLQHKRDSQKCIALAKQTPLRGAYQLIERLQCRLETSPREKRLWKNAKEVAILIAQVVIARCMVVSVCGGAARSALYCCARSLAARAPARLLAAGAALAAPAPTARHLHTLAAAVRAHLSPSNEQTMKPFVCELYVRAITAGMNELEKLKLKTEKEAEAQARVAAQTLAAWLLQLGGVVCGRVAAECALTAFSLHPSPHMYDCLVAVPALARQVKNEPKVEASSEFGSWANDSRTKTNFVKTSETLNIKHTQNQANILSTAILNEGEGLGLSLELCQDIAVVLSGPRVKTFSWDMDREELLEKCRAYMERTHGGTKAVTTELKYLNLDHSKYQHLPEDRDEDEDDIYYGIEKGYEHLVQFEEHEEMWRGPSEEERTLSASPTFLKDDIVPARKKKNRRLSGSADEDTDPLSTVAEARRQQKKERPHSKERSRTKKERKKKREVDPLQLDNETNETKAQKKTKEKKEKKTKEKTNKVQGDKLSNLVGLKIEKQNSQSSDVNSKSSEGTSADVKNLNRSDSTGSVKNMELSQNVKVASNETPVAKKPSSDPNNFTYKPWEPNFHPPSAGNVKKPVNWKPFPDDVRASISKLLEFRRQKAADPNYRQPKMNAHMVQKKPNAIINPENVQMQAKISPKAVTIPEIPKSYIDKQRAEKLIALKKGVDLLLSQRKQNSETSYDLNAAIQSPVIQYAAKPKTDAPVPDLSGSYTKSQPPHAGVLKMSDIVGVSTDRQTTERLQRQNSCNAVYDIVRPPRPVSTAANAARDRPPSVAMSGQKDYLHFLKEYQAMRSRAMGADQVLDMSAKASKDTSKDIKPVSRVAPVVPNVNKAEQKTYASAKPPLQQKKPDTSLNTFSRLSYMHKNKQTELKNKAATERSFTFSTYQEISTELDEIIKKHKNEQKKVIQAKNDKERLKEPPIAYHSIDDTRKNNQNQSAHDHPTLSGMLDQKNAYTSAVPPQQKIVSPLKSSLTSSDQKDILSLLRQQNKLNSNTFYQTTSIYPSTSKSGGETPHSVTLPVQNPTSYPVQQTQSAAKPVSIQSTLETKLINIISNSLIKPADDVNLKSSEPKNPQSVGKKNTKSDNQNKVKKIDSKVQKDKKSAGINPAKNHSWESVMNDILKHKTPSRGPNALDVALNKSSFEKVFENSLKEPSTIHQQPTIVDSDYDDRKYLPKGQTPKSVNPQYVNIVTKKGEKVMKQQPVLSKCNDPKKSISQSKSEGSNNKKAAKTNSSETSKKLPHEVQRKQFTYAGPKHDDPFISGIPNSDYDLLEELMDDDLRKEIGELSSDEESFNDAARSFLTTPKGNEKRVTVQVNSQPLETVGKKTVTHTQNLSPHLTTDGAAQKTSQKPVQKCDNVKGNITMRNTQGIIASVITQNNTSMNNHLVISQNIPAAIAHCSDVNTLTSAPINPNIYISAVSQQPPVHNVVLIGSELVYDAYSTAQAPIVNNVSGIAPNAYVAVNNAPNMTLYQSPAFAAPIVNPMLINNMMSGPIINTVPCAAPVSVQTPINGVVQPTVHATNVKHTHINTSDINEEARADNKSNNEPINNVTKEANERLQDVNIKINDRKVLSEVQEKLTAAENTEKVKIQVTEFENDVKKEISDDKERLMKKRLAIINRDIYHRCGNTPIALSYSPLLSTNIELNSHSIPETSMSPILPKHVIHTHEMSEASLPNNEAIPHSNIVNNIRNISSPVTPDNNENCKENKNNRTPSCRRILLRSSNKSNVEIIIPEQKVNKKSKLKLKSEIPMLDEKVNNTSSQNDKTAKRISKTKRTSKRIHNKKTNNAVEQLKLTDQTKPATKPPGKKSTVKSAKITYNRINSDIDIEEELLGSKISIKNNHHLLNSNLKLCQQEILAAPDHILSVERPVSDDKKNIMFDNSFNFVDVISSKRHDGVSEIEPNCAANAAKVCSNQTLTSENSSSMREYTTPSTPSMPSVRPECNEKLLKENIHEFPNSTETTVKYSCTDLLQNDNIDLDMTVTEETNVTQKTLPNYSKVLSPSLAKTLVDPVIENQMQKVDQNSTELKKKSPKDLSVENAVNMEDNILIMNGNCGQQINIDKNNVFQNTVDSTDCQLMLEDINKKHEKDDNFKDENASEVDDDIQIIDDNFTQTSKQCNILQKESKNTKNPVGTNAHPNHINDSSGLSQSFKDRIIIEEIHSKESTNKKCVRVKLPNGKTFKATAYGDKHVNFDTLFHDPYVKATLLNTLNNQKRYTMSINQISTVAKSDPSKILSTKIRAIKPASLGLPPCKLETIDLLSDEDDDYRSEGSKTQMSTLETEFGSFKIAPMDEDILAQHQIKLRHKPIVQLRRLDQKSELTNDILAKNKISSSDVPDIIEIDETSNDTIDLNCYEKCETSPKLNELKEALLYDLGVKPVESTLKLSSRIADNNKVKEIKTQTAKENTTVNKLKDDLSQDFAVTMEVGITSVRSHKTRESNNVSITDEIISLDDDDDSPNEQPNKNDNKSVTNCSHENNNSTTATSKYKLIDKLCYVKLIRCDDLIKQKSKSIIHNTNEMKIDESYNSFNTLSKNNSVNPVPTSDNQGGSDKVLNVAQILEDISFPGLHENTIESDTDRSSSPVIELFDVLASLGSTYHVNKTLEYESIALTCEADWFSSKQNLRCVPVETIHIPQDYSKANLSCINNDSAPPMEEKQLKINVPTLLSFVLNILQDDNVISRYQFRRELNQSARSLKRKSTLTNASLMPKVLKIGGETGEHKINGVLQSKHLPLITTTFNSTTADICHSGNNGDNSMLCTQEFTRNISMNENYNKPSRTNDCEDLRKEIVFDAKVNISEDLTETDCSDERRSLSPVIEISAYLLENDYANKVNDNPKSPPILEIPTVPSLVTEEINLKDETEFSKSTESKTDELLCERKIMQLTDHKSESPNKILDKSFEGNCYNDQEIKTTEVEQIDEEIDSDELVNSYDSYVNSNADVIDIEKEDNNSNEVTDIMNPTTLVETDLEADVLYEDKTLEHISCKAIDLMTENELCESENEEKQSSNADATHGPETDDLSEDVDITQTNNSLQLSDCNQTENTNEVSKDKNNYFVDGTAKVMETKLVQTKCEQLSQIESYSPEWDDTMKHEINDEVNDTTMLTNADHVYRTHNCYVKSDVKEVFEVNKRISPLEDTLMYVENVANKQEIHNDVNVSIEPTDKLSTEEEPNRDYKDDCEDLKESDCVVKIENQLSAKSESKEDRSEQSCELTDTDLLPKSEEIKSSEMTIPDLSVESEKGGKDNMVSFATDKNKQSDEEEYIVILRNKSTAIIDHEYLGPTTFNYYGSRSCTGKDVDRVNYSIHDIVDEESSEIVEEVISMDGEEVIDITHTDEYRLKDLHEKTGSDERQSLFVDETTEIDSINANSENSVAGNAECIQYADNTEIQYEVMSKDCSKDLDETVSFWNLSVKNMDISKNTRFCYSNVSTEKIIGKYLAFLGESDSELSKTVKEIRYEDSEAETCIVIPIIDKGSDKNDLKETVHALVKNIIEGKNMNTECEESYKMEPEYEDLNVILPQRTYKKNTNKKEIRRFKRRLDMSDILFNHKRTRYNKYRKNSYIDYPNSSNVEDVSYAKEYKKLFDYCSSINFSYSIPFHKEYIDVQNVLKSWPIQEEPSIIEDDKLESKEMLFIDTPDRISEKFDLTLAEEIVAEFNENDYKSIKIAETNFSKGFGDGSGRVKQEQRDGEYTTYSAATLSDVKQIQPFLPSAHKQESCTENKSDDIENENQDHKKIRHFYDNLNLKEKLRSFFEKTQFELTFDWAKNHKKDDLLTNWPFGLSSPEYIRPAPVSMTVNVVQVGQLPVSAGAQNPVTCDPRVTHVSNVSPSQCSPQNNSGDDIQTSIKTEYTELTTADITLPLMQDYVQHHHNTATDPQESQNVHSGEDNIPMATEITSVVKIELMEETSQEQIDENMRYETHRELTESNINNSEQYHYDNVTNNMVHESDASVQPVINSSEEQNPNCKIKQLNDAEKTDQIAHAMSAAGITASQDIAKPTDAESLVDIISQNAQSDVVTSHTNNNYSKSPITSMALQQALAQILPPPLNHQANNSENSQHSTANPQVLHIVQGNSTPSVINKANGTQVLHIVQNKNTANGTPTSQANAFSGLSLVDGAIQQNGNLLHIVNTAQKNNNNPGQLLKRVNLLTNLANVQGSNDKMVHVLCKSADGKSIQLPPQRSMVLRLQPLDPPNLQTTAKQNDDIGPSNVTHPVNSNGKETSPQEIKSRSLYEENYAKFVQNGDTKPSQEKATSLPKFNQVFGKQVYQDKQNEIENNNMEENPSECPAEENLPLEQMSDIANPPMLIRKTQNQPTLPAQAQPNLVQQIKQTIGPMNIPMHGGVIYTRQIPVNIGNGQTINLITVPSTEIVDDSNQKLQTDGKFGSQEGDSPIIKIVQNNQPTTATNGSTEDNNGHMGSSNEVKPQQAQPQPVLTQMRIKLPMLSKAPQMVGGARVVRPSFFQIQRNVIGGANQQVYQQLVLTAAPPIGQSIRLPAQTQKPKTPSETQSSPESQMSSSTLEQLREFDMVLEQVKERSTVQPGSSTSNNNFSKQSTPADTTDGATPSTSTLKQDAQTPVLFSVGTTQPINIANFVNRKSTITSTSTSSFVRSPDSTAITESPSSSTQVHLPHTSATTESCASSSCASEAAAAATTSQPKPKKKSKPKSSSSSSNPFKINSTPPKTSTQKPLEDEQTTQRILYILAEYKEQVENSPDKDKPAPRRRNNPAAPAAGTSKRKKSSSGSRKRDSSPIGEDSCRTMGSEDSSCGTSLGECNECLESHSPEESPRKVVRRLTFEQETTQVTQTRTTTIPQRNVIVADGQAFAVRGTTGKPATTVLMPANYLLPVSMVKGGQQIAIVTNRGPKLLVGAGEGGTGGTLLFQRLIGPAGLKPVLTRPGVRHIRLPTAALHNLQTFNIATPATTVQPPDSTASPAPAPAPPDLVDTRAMSSPWPDRGSESGEQKADKGNSSPEGSEPWNLPTSSIADDYGYEEIVRTDNMDRTVLDAIPDRYSPDMEAQRIFDKMFDVDSKKSMYDSRCSYDIDASDDDKAYHQVVQRKDGRHHRLTHVSAAALRHKYAILEHELRLQKSLSEECEDLGVDSPSASELFPEAELLFAPSPAHEQTIDLCHTPQSSLMSGIPQPDLDDQIASDRLLTPRHDLDIGLDDVGEIVTVGEDGVTTVQLDHEEFARSHPNTTFHSEPEDGEIPPFTIAQGLKGRPIAFGRGVPGTVVMAPQTTVISQATVEAAGAQNTVKFADIDNMINAMPSPRHRPDGPSVLVKDDSPHKFDSLEREHPPASAGAQVIRRADARYPDDKAEDRRDEPWDDSRRFDSEDKCCRGYEEGGEALARADSVIKAARSERRDDREEPPLRTYAARRARCLDDGRRRASNRGVVKRGCHCCNATPKPKKAKKRPADCHPH